MSNDFNFPDVSIVKSSKIKDSLKVYVGSKAFIKGFGLELPESCKKNSITQINPDSYVLLIGKLTTTKQICDSFKQDFIKSKNLSLFVEPSGINFKIILSSLILYLKSDWNLKTKSKTIAKTSIEIVTNKTINIKKAIALAKCQAFVQQLVNMPSNILTPSKYPKFITEFIEKEGLNNSITIKVLKENELKKENMNSFLAVAKGSVEKPVLLVLEYNLKKSKKPLVLVGKGLTFDSGGISIKPSLGMDAMKGDMAGSAAAISGVLYSALTDSKKGVVAICPICENMPSHKSVKPGDVVYASNGTSIEVIDTDAEGRLVLADALEYSKKYNGKYTIDLATLTGACVIALGSIHSGLFTNNEKLKNIIMSASESSGDLVWQLPLTKEHEDMLTSKIADISNLCIGKGAGASNGAVFLKHFAPKKTWAHLDIAGTATPKGVMASGRPVPLLSEIIDNF